MKYRDDSTGAAIIATVAVWILLLLIEPFVCFWLSYFSGWIAEITIGSSLCNALNTLFRVATFVPSDIPPLAGALGWIGSFFQNIVSRRINSD